MGSLPRFNLDLLQRNYGCTCFVETGTGSGAGVLYAAQSAPFRNLYTIEMHSEVAAMARKALAGNPRITLLEGASEDCLQHLLPQLSQEQPILFWLDAHFPGADFGLAGYNDYEDDDLRLPLERELSLIKALRPQAQDVFCIDDLRIYEDGPFASGPMPDFAQTLPESRRNLDFLDTLFGSSHAIHRVYHEEGYILLLPGQSDAPDPGQFLRSDVTAPSLEGVQHEVQTMDECGKATLRRLQQADYVSRFFLGKGIDVGAGSDPLSAYIELFPLVTDILDWDWQEGDAQYLQGIADESLDFLHSSHCLEHLQDPREGLKNWFRVIRPGGHMIITVPDEDLYEQGVFPSTFNGDHKWSFTIYKHRSWCEKSCNLLDLVRELGPAADVKRIVQLDTGQRYNLPRQDQSMSAVGECAIELVIRKRPLAEIEAGGRLPAERFQPLSQKSAAQNDSFEQVKALQARLADLEAQNTALLRSTSWRLTAPLRWLKAVREELKK